MQAIVNIAGFQFRVQKDDTIVVPKLDSDTDETVTFNDVVMTINDNQISTGGGSVTGKVIEHGRDDKVLVFHKKRRKGYQKMNGHRQHFTTIQITDVSA